MLNNSNFKFYSLLLFFLTSCDSVVSKYESYKRAHHNPYLNFQEAIDCECKNEDVISPQLKIFKKDEISEKTEAGSFKKIFVTFENLPKNKNLFIKYNINQCGIIGFNTNDLLKVKGQMYLEGQNYIIEPLNGYIELNGRKFCLDL